MQKKLPQFIHKYFWEVNPKNVDVDMQSHYIIERILEYGDMEDIKWIWKAYPKKAIIEAVKTSRAISKKTANYWAVILGIPKSKILCFSKQFQQTSRAIWKR